MDLTGIHTLTFDCYGTLIDWETGILKLLRRILDAHKISLGDQEILELYATLEAEAESGAYRSYREVMGVVMKGLGERLTFKPSPLDLVALPYSMQGWQPFPDTVDALRSLKQRFKLAIVSNVDDDLFASNCERFKVRFDWVVTAQQARAYKPSPVVFEYALKQIGQPPEAILHVAQSLFHDIAPASRWGIKTVWLNRPSLRPGFGATPPTTARPDLELPNLTALTELLIGL